MNDSNNNIDTLNDVLFEQLQTLNTDLSPDQMQQEIWRANAMANVAETILKGKKLQLDAVELMNKMDNGNNALLTGIAPAPAATLTIEMTSSHEEN